MRNVGFLESAFKDADVGAVIAAVEAELFLRDAAFGPRFSQHLREGLLRARPRPAGSLHPLWMLRQMQTILLQSMQLHSILCR